MANVIFEEGTQLQASGFVAGDTLLFKTAAPSDVGVTYNAPSGFNVATVTLTIGDQSLTFAADALGDADTNITFFAEDGQLVFGTAGNDGALAVTSDADSAAYGFDGIDTISVSGDGNHLVYGGAGADAITVTGGEGNHNIFGDAGDDAIDAGDAEGHLNIFGGAGSDSILGGSGNDHIYGQSAAGGTDGDDVIDGGAGNDYIQGNAGEDQLNGGEGRDRINGGADDDTISGDAGNDTVNGNKGDDVIDGGLGDDSLRGGAGNDEISGGAGNDAILGDLGDDTITGGDGTDLLTGGEGADVFVFAAGDVDSVTISGTKYYETITDFSTDEDIISLTGLTVTEDNLIFQNSGVAFTTVTAALDYVEGVLVAGTAAGSVAAIQVGADTYLFYDSDGEYTTDQTIDSIIKLTGVTASDLTEDNFTLPVVA
ncbi:calcium-binding protein [Sphingomonas histidinilytica]|jgi:serralysin|uniref:Hemolysin-type calcium-binding repeat-containing protein n=1 Tax=Rhizorhabdus histidinilytica TaxID=439228 RepID=A0A1T5B520_9SPHN|nr:calcium-binding protein [Rhizorhabdus histidinilytica]MBO9379764.1 calcium-binding protein [Rhizorhabdus histidinilytica]QEH79389.1 calcium-binding protein [Sphingomonas sp. C8-2]SKB42060.1 Hemolysin-type calcium-binding repeat-containing protein [Rhizorhabdus histidinilytica]